MKARIYRPAKNAMQSGQAKTKSWVVEFAAEAPKRIDPLMGWIGSSDTQIQMRLTFPSRDEAIAYAKREGLEFTIEAAKDSPHILKSYADKFRFDKIA